MKKYVALVIMALLLVQIKARMSPEERDAR